MTPTVGRTAFVLLLLGFCLLMPRLALAQDNLLSNGDFSNGTQNWEGDFADSSTDDPNPLAGPSSSAGQVIALHEVRAARIFQPFTSAEATHLHLTVTYTFSPGLGGGTGDGKLADVLRGFDQNPSANGNQEASGGRFFTPVAVLVDTETEKSEACLVMGPPMPVKSDGRDIEIQVKPHTHYRLYLAFPPARGSVLITSAKLSETAPPAPANSSSQAPAPAAVPEPNQPVQFVAPETQPPSALVPPSATVQDNILANGDFSNGTDAWAGDFGAPSTDDLSPTDPGSLGTAGQVLNLHEKRPVQISQAFTSNTARTLYLSVQFAYAPRKDHVHDLHTDGDVKVSDVVTGLGYSQPFDGPDAPKDYAFGRDYIATGPSAFIVDTDHSKVCVVSLKVNPQGGHHGTIDEVNVAPGLHYQLYIAFPPGTGSVYVSSVVLSTKAPSVPTSTTATPPQSPLAPAPVVAPQPNQPPAPIVAPSQ